jgi:DNA-binding NtrC family response regulator
VWTALVSVCSKQDHKLCRNGNEVEIDVEFRLIVTTSRDTTTLLKEGLLTKDLYFCISTIKIKVPPLRGRLDDVPLLAHHFLTRFNKQYGRKVRGISRETLFCLLCYDWPGNIRELESVIERAVLFCSGDRLLPGCLPEELQDNRLHNIPFVIPPLVPIEVIEREAIRQTLARTSGNVRQSAKILHYSRPTFYRKLKKFGIKVDRSP